MGNFLERFTQIVDPADEKAIAFNTLEGRRPAALDELLHVFDDRINHRVSLGVTYWYDKYAVEDFTLDFDTQTALNTGRNLLLYYTYTPYTAHTTWGRLMVRW